MTTDQDERRARMRDTLAMLLLTVEPAAWTAAIDQLDHRYRGVVRRRWPHLKADEIERSSAALWGDVLVRLEELVAQRGREAGSA